MQLLIQISLFTRNANVLLLDEENQEIANKYSIKMDELPVLIPDLCTANNIKNVAIKGSKKYAAKIGDMIKQNGISKYNLNIEVDYI